MLGTRCWGQEFRSPLAVCLRGLRILSGPGLEWLMPEGQLDQVGRTGQQTRGPCGAGTGGSQVNHCQVALTPPPALAALFPPPAAPHASSGATGRWAWVPSLCPLPGMALLLLLLLVPCGAQPQAGRVSAEPVARWPWPPCAHPGSWGRGGLWNVGGLQLGESWPSAGEVACWLA